MHDNLQVDFMSAVAAAEYTCTEPHLFISIRDVRGERVALPPNEHRVDAIFAKFDDVNREYPGMKLFTIHDAVAMTEFVMSHPEVNLVLVNCVAGVSRSCGVAVGLDQLFNGGRGYTRLITHGVPNSLITRTFAELDEPRLNAEAYDGPVPDCSNYGCDQGCCFGCPDVRACGLVGETCRVLRTRYATPEGCMIVK